MVNLLTNFQFDNVQGNSSVPTLLLESFIKKGCIEVKRIKLQMPKAMAIKGLRRKNVAIECNAGMITSYQFAATRQVIFLEE